MKVNDANAQAYQYDELYQLIYVDYNDGNTTTNYYYDSLGNRTSVTNGKSIPYNRNSLNQYTKVADVNYSYDKNGNLTNDGRFHYYYDCENYLIEVNDINDSRVASYRYDYAGRRIRKITYDANGQTLKSLKYYYYGDQIVAEANAISGQILRRFIYGPGIDEPICIQRYAGGGGAGWFYYHFDGLGSVVAISNSSGQLVEHYSYDVFGDPTIRDANNSVVSVSSVANPYMFTGREYDDETGLYYYRARYYSPQIGRFLQTDPIDYEGGLNLYTYCWNDPVNLVDSWGLFPMYGRWGGRGYGAGVPINDMDACFRDHDNCWGKADDDKKDCDEKAKGCKNRKERKRAKKNCGNQHGKDKNKCDKRLVNCLKGLSDNPYDWGWEKPPTSEDAGGAFNVRADAIFYFEGQIDKYKRRHH